MSTQTEIGTAVASREDSEQAPEVPEDPTYRPAQGMDVEKLMHVAIEREGAIDVIKELVNLRNQEMDRQAKHDFHAAFAQFKRNCPTIPRDTPGKKLAADDGSGYVTLMYAGLETIQHYVDPVLVDLGFSYSWTVPSATEKSLKVVCVLQHESGHSVESEMIIPISPIPKATGGQQFAGARTTGKRLTLSDVLGIATDDAEEAGSGTWDTVDDDQLRELRALVQKKDVDIDRFLEFAGAESLKEIPQASFGMAKRFLESRKDK